MVIAKFDPTVFNKIRTINDPVIGEISYGVLTVRELVELETMPEGVDKTIRVVYTMLHKANPEVTEDTIRDMDSDAVIYLSTILQESADFRVSRPSRSSGPTTPPEPSARP